MALRTNKSNEEPASRSHAFHGLPLFFNGVPDGLGGPPKDWNACRAKIAREGPLRVSTEWPIGLRPTKTDKDLPQATDLFSMPCAGSSTVPLLRLNC